MLKLCDAFAYIYFYLTPLNFLQANVSLLSAAEKLHCIYLFGIYFYYY